MQVTVWTYIGIFSAAYWFVFWVLPVIDGEHR